MSEFTETIGTKLTEVIGTIVPFFLDEAEVEEYPFATYDNVVTPFRTKDGVYKYVANVRVYIISDDPEEVETKAALVRAAIETNMNDGKYVSLRGASQKQCYEGIWDLDTEYVIIQHY